MSGRIDWHGEPDAPEVNSLVPSASVFVQDEAGAVLLNVPLDGVKPGAQVKLAGAATAKPDAKSVDKAVVVAKKD